MIVIIYSEQYLREEKRRLEEGLGRKLAEKHLGWVSKAVKKWAKEERKKKKMKARRG